MEVGGGDIGTGIEGGPINPPGPGVGAALGPVGAALGPAGAVQDPGQRRRKRNEYRKNTIQKHLIYYSFLLLDLFFDFL